MKKSFEAIPLNISEQAKILGVTKLELVTYQLGYDLQNTTIQKRLDCFYNFAEEQLCECIEIFFLSPDKLKIAAPFVRRLRLEINVLEAHLIRNKLKLKAMERDYRDKRPKFQLLNALRHAKVDIIYDPDELIPLKTRINKEVAKIDRYEQLLLEYRITRYNNDLAAKKNLLKELTTILPEIHDEDTIS
ncbi:hypothetical protein ACLOAU_00655 [Niabella sp. CJ426]|uniref:hypothetical protein n=1 Tax=Niabella sp. CJ426 TaxID=3393740 RepID=UPI003CFE44D2